MKKRIMWIDVLKGICMIFVVISHASPLNIWVRLFTPFFLSGFFFASGYTFSQKSGIKEFFISKIKSLIIPLLFFSVINGIVGVIFKGVPFSNRIIGMLVQRAGIAESLWFISCLFTVELMFYIIVSTLKRNTLVSMVSFIITILGLLYMKFVNYSLPWQFEIACGVLFFFCMGYEYRIYDDKFEFIFRRKYYMLICVIYLVICAVYENNVNIHDKIYGNILVYLISSILGIYIVVYCSKLFEKSKVLSYIGNKSLVYFAFQGFLLETIRKVLLIIGFPIRYKGTLCVITVSIALPLLSIAAYVIYQYMPFLVGKRKITS